MSSALFDGLVRASIQGGLLCFIVWLALRIPTMRRMAGGWIWFAVLAKFVISMIVVFRLPVLPPAAPATDLGFPGGPFLKGEAVSALPAVPSVHLPWAEYLLWAWAFGLGIVLIRTFTAHGKVMRMVRESHDARSELREIAAAMIGRPIPVKLHPDASVPMVTGLFRPMILLPALLEEEMSADEIRMVLAHEAAHIVRGDIAGSLVAFLCFSPFYFHPAAWFARREWHLAGECECDSFAMRTTNASPRAYGELLIKISTRAKHAPAHALSIAPVVKTLHRRIENMKNPTKSLSRIGIAIAAVAATAIALPYALVPRSPKPQESIKRTDERKMQGSPEKMLRDAEAELQRAVKAGQLTPEEAKTKLTALKQRLAQRQRSEDEMANYKAQLMEKARRGEISEADAKKQLQIAIEKQAIQDEQNEMDVIRQDLMKAVANGQITQADADAKLRNIEAERKMVRRRSGEITEEDIQKAMKSGHLSRDEAITKLKILRSQEDQIRGRGNGIAAAEEEIKRMVADGKITKQEAEKRQEVLRRQAQKEQQAKADHDFEQDLERAVADGKITKEQAKEKLDAYRKQKGG